MHIPSPIAWNPDNSIRILDQTLLPGSETYRDLASVDEVAEAIRTLRVRGAPLIGIAAAMGVVVSIKQRGSGACPEQSSEGAAGQAEAKEAVEREAEVKEAEKAVSAS